MKILFNERTLLNENIIPLTDAEYADYARRHTVGEDAQAISTIERLRNAS